jgi:hypothetical protein
MVFKTQDQFAHYLAGLIEGAGSFTLNSLVIVLKKQDLELAYFLQQRLGFGLVFVSDTQIVFKVEQQQDLDRVFRLVNGRLVGNRCILQLQQHNWRVEKTMYPPLGKVSLDTAWFAGYFDACGDLEIIVCSRQKSRLKMAANLKFSINLTEPTELSNLNCIADVFNISTYEGNEKARSFKLSSGQIDKARLLVTYLDVFNLRTSKWTQFQIFRNATAFVEAKQHLSDKGLALMAQWKDNCINVYPVALGKRQPVPDILVPTVPEGEPMAMADAHYLAGLIEGSGAFTATDLTITFRTEDIEQAEALQNQLRFGEVKVYKDEVLFQVTDPKGLAHIIGLVNGKFIGDKCISQLREHRYDSLLKVTLLPALGKVSLANAWLAGFLDVKVVFCIWIPSTTPSQTRKRFPYIKCMLFEPSPSGTVSQLNSLRLIGEVFDINHTKSSFYSGSYSVDIVGQARMKVIFAYFDMFPLKSRKAMQLQIMRDCHALIQTKRHLSQEGIELMELARQKLTAIYKSNY